MRTYTYSQNATCLQRLGISCRSMIRMFAVVSKIRHFAAQYRWIASWHKPVIHFAPYTYVHYKCEIHSTMRLYWSLPL